MMYTSDLYNNIILFWTIALSIPIGPLYCAYYIDTAMKCSTKVHNYYNVIFSLEKIVNVKKNMYIIYLLATTTLQILHGVHST